MPKFSIVLASYLKPYPGAATYRQEKFIRAVDSVLNQALQDWELVIVADGCTLTTDLYKQYYVRHNNIKLVELPKQKLWSGNVRNAGIAAATGEYITYLDTDDKLGPEHLSIINSEAIDQPWIWYDDYIMGMNYRPRYNVCQLTHGRCGTSNITHRRSLNARWNDSTYAHDWRFIQTLMAHKGFTKVATPEYYICHLPNRLDV